MSLCIGFFQQRQEELVDQRVRAFHAQSGQEGQDEGPFPDDDIFSVPEETPEGEPGESGRQGDQADIEDDLDIAEFRAGNFGDDGRELVAGQDPGIGDHLDPDTDGCQQDADQAEDHPEGITVRRNPLDGPDGGVAQVAEHEGGRNLHQVLGLEFLAEQDHLRQDEEDMHHPSEGADTDGAPFEMEYGRRAGDGRRAEVGFQGKGYADGDQDQTEGRDTVVDENILEGLLRHFVSINRQISHKIPNFATFFGLNVSGMPDRKRNQMYHDNMKKVFVIMAAALFIGACGQKGQDKVPALDMSYLDTTVSPGEDFYRYATGGWQDAHPLPAEYSRYGSFDVLSETTQTQLNELFAEMTKISAPRGSVDQKISDLYKMALDSLTRNQLGAAPIQPYIAEIQAVSSKEDLSRLLGRMMKVGEGGFFRAGVEADMVNSDIQVLSMGQGGLGMGDRDYYLDPKNAELKAGYKAYLVKIFQLAGLNNAEELATKDLVVEDALAEANWTREKSRDVEASYNPMTSAQIYKNWPAVRFDLIMKEAGIPDQDKVIVGQPSFFDGLNQIFAKTDLETLKAYMLADFISGSCGSLDDAFYTANWEFFSHQLAGAQEQRPRWKRAMAVPNSLLGQAVGKMYVEKYFPASSKEKMVTLVENLRTALGQHIDELDWMSDATKARAREKLAAFTVKIGYPDKWKDYSTLDIDPDKTYYENLRAASAWYTADNLSKLGQPTDREEWGMTPQTVNAYYNPSTNEICFPAGILQKPFFDPNADEAVNYGGIGVVIGHEMSHGFDDQGSMFDAVGNMVNWWTDEDKAKFDEKAAILGSQYDAVEILPGLHGNGAYTMGENIGDHGGISIAWTAMENAIAGNRPGLIDGFTPEQRFWLSYGAIWAQNITDQEKARRTAMDVHSIGENRVNVAIRNFQEFFDAFGITEGQKMYRPESERVRIW